MIAIARRLGCTEGQLYTALIGLVLAVLLAVAGIPAVLGSHGSPASSVPSAPTPGVHR